LEKIKIAFIFQKDNIFLSGKHFDNTYYHFFMNALQRNDKLLVKNFPVDKIIDCEEMKGKIDAILLWENSPFGMPEKILNIEKLDIPVICKAGDPNRAKDSIKYHDKWKIDHYFHFLHEEFFHELYPKKFNFLTLFFGLEKKLFEKTNSFDERIKKKILLTGATGNTKISSKIINSLRNPKWNAYESYRLRTRCKNLPYVDYTPTLQHEYINDKFSKLLQKYSAAIAATTNNPNIKYWETAGSECLTFMEITEKNRGQYLGFKNNESCIVINEENFEDKFLEYLDDIENPKWKEIALEGKKHAIENFDNDIAAEKLASLFSTYVHN
tara:strand:- start:740 stop:1717 length:978 start_codon:yes stop_codon:yes gene_type:complete